MMQIKKPRVVYNDTWRFNAYFFIDFTFKQYSNFLKQHLDYDTGIDEFSGDGYSLSCPENGAFIWAKEDDPAIIAHEAFHCGNYLLSCAGVKNEPSNDEPLAYLITWFMNNYKEKKDVGVG